jgi:hypothetical protein
MHDTANTVGGLFMDRYARPDSTIIELGSMNVNGTPRASDWGPGSMLN